MDGKTPRESPLPVGADQQRARVDALDRDRNRPAQVDGRLAASPRPFLATRPDGRIEFANTAFESLCGRSLDELRGLNWLAGLTPPEWRAAEGAALQELNETGWPARYRKVCLHAQGTRIAVDVLVHLAPGAADLYYSHLTPLAEAEQGDLSHRLAQEAMAESERHTRTFTDTLPYGVVYHAADGSILSMNPAAANILGKSGPGFIGSTLADQEHDWVREDGSPLPGPEHPVMVALATGHEVRGLRLGFSNPRQEHRRWIDVTAIPLLRPAESRPYQVYAVFEDVTERKHAEEALHRQRQWLQVTLQSIGDAVLATDISGSVVLLNPVAVALTGWSEAAALGQPASEVFRIVDERTGEPSPDIVARVLRDGLPVALANSTALVARNGRLIPIEDSAAPIRDAEGRMAGAVLVFHDVTERRRAQERLRQSEERFRVAQELSPDGFAIIRPVRDAAGAVVDFVWIYCNAAGATLNGGAPADYIGHRVLEGIPTLRSTAFYDAYCKVCETGQPLVVESALPLDGAAPAWLRVTVVPMGGDIAVHSHDLTEHKRSEEALRESRATLDAALASMTDAVFIADAERRIIRFNEAFAAFHRFRDSNECAGALADYPSLLEARLPDGTPAPLEMWAVPRALRGEVAVAAEYTLRRKDTGETWVGSYNFAPIRDKNGAVVGAVVAARDITDRKRAEEALLASERRFALMFERAAFALALARLPQARIVNVNEAWVRTFGYSKQEAAGKTALELSIIPSVETRDQIRSRLEQGGRLREIELDLHTRSGEQRTFLTSYDVIEISGEQYALCSHQDITERKRAEERLRESQKLESLGLLAGGVAHDFNNLLVGVVGSASLAQEMIDPDHPAAELIRAISRSGEQAAHLTRQMLAYAGKGHFLTETLDLSAVASEMSELIRTSMSKTIKVTLDLRQGLPPVEADRGQIQQILMNLAINGAEAIGSHGVLSLRTGRQRVDEAFIALHREASDLRPGEYVFLEVRDSGCGMDDATRSRIFDPFFSTKFTGRGLGLAAVAGIVRTHRGGILVATAPGHGSCFTVLLPASTAAPTPAPPSGATVSVQGAGVILVVDDEALVRDMTQRILTRRGYTVRVAGSGLDAIELLRDVSVKIDLVILDLGMPVMSGQEALPELLRVRPGLKVLVTSGYSEAETMELFRGQPVAGFLEKPYTAAVIAERVKLALT
jgi:PAS domain S-box-containing protein